jgi:glycosyltransferase involved in cell wall biosynthesis
MMKPLSRVICATRFIKECSDREKIIPAHKSQVIYSASDTQREHGSGVEFRERFGIPADRMVVLKVSWLVPDKGIDVALRAASRTLAERKDLHYVFCGDGEGKARYQQMARDLGIEDHVTWTGQMQDLVGMGAFRAADLQIQCSQWQEAFCFAVAEGMSAGLPIVASRIGGLPELVTEGENGFLFEPASDQMLATHILRLASDAVLREAMGRSSQARAVKDFELKACVQQWVGLVSARAREG